MQIQERARIVFALAATALAGCHAAAPRGSASGYTVPSGLRPSPRGPDHAPKPTEGTSVPTERPWSAWETGEPGRLAQTDELPQPAHYPNLYRKFGLDLGGAIYGNFDTTMRVDSDVLIGASLDMEDFLGIDDQQEIFRADAYYHFNPRHRVDMSYYAFNRSGSKVVGQDINFGEVTIPAGTVHTDFNTDIFKVAYRYNFVSDYRTTIGVSAGLHVMGIEAGLKSADFSVSDSFRVAAPLPLFGLHGSYALSEKWALRASAELFQVTIEDVSGFINDNRLTLEHDVFKNFGWGIGLNGFTMDVDIEGGSLDGEIEYAYQGLFLFLRMYF